LWCFCQRKTFCPCRETPENALKKQGKKMSVGGWVGLGFRKCAGGSVGFFLGGPSGASRGGRKKKRKKTQCTYVLYLARIELLYTYDVVIFFIAFLSSPYRETPKNARTKIR
jgi:hypothetical protein